MKVCILAPGPSMSQALADSLRSEICIVVNNCYQLAPWADSLAAQDHAWWRAHPDALQFAGRKFSANKIAGVEQIFSDYVGRPSSSGVLALEVARRRLLQGRNIETGDEVELHGFDNRGTHYFGPHPEPLRNTTAERFKVFEQQLSALGKQMQKAGVRIVNKTPNSALTCFPTA